MLTRGKKNNLSIKVYLEINSKKSFFFLKSQWYKASKGTQENVCVSSADLNISSAPWAVWIFYHRRFFGIF